MTTFASQATTINIQRYLLDDFPVGYIVPLATIAGFTFVLTIEGVCTIEGTIVNPTEGDVEFDPANAEDLLSAPYDATTLVSGNYSYYIVMVDTAADERTIVRGIWRVSPRAP